MRTLFRSFCLHVPPRPLHERIATYFPHYYFEGNAIFLVPLYTLVPFHQRGEMDAGRPGVGFNVPWLSSSVKVPALLGSMQPGKVFFRWDAVRRVSAGILVTLKGEWRMG